MSGLFHNLGRRLGRAAVPAVRKAKWFYDGLTGDEEESLRAETGLGRALAAELRAVTQPMNDPAIAALGDELGLRLAIAARFPPAGAIALLRRIERLGTDPGVRGQYFASPPPASERITRGSR